MTKYESQILKYLKRRDNTDRFNILNQFGKDDFLDRASGNCSLIRHEDRLDCLITAGYIESDGAMLRITPKGVHELDEYLENQTRLDRVEKLAIIANVISFGAFLAAVIK